MHRHTCNSYSALGVPGTATQDSPISQMGGKTPPTAHDTHLLLSFFVRSTACVRSPIFSAIAFVSCCRVSFARTCPMQSTRQSLLYIFVTSAMLSRFIFASANINELSPWLPRTQNFPFSRPLVTMGNSSVRLAAGSLAIVSRNPSVTLHQARSLRHHECLSRA